MKFTKSRIGLRALPCLPHACTPVWGLRQISRHGAGGEVLPSFPRLLISEQRQEIAGGPKKACLSEHLTQAKRTSKWILTENSWTHAMLRHWTEVSVLECSFHWMICHKTTIVSTANLLIETKIIVSTNSNNIPTQLLIYL